MIRTNICRRHYCLVPLLAVVMFGSTMTIGWAVRMGLRATDINWTKNKQVDYAVNHYTAKDYKLVNPLGRAETSRPSPRPDFTK